MTLLDEIEQLATDADTSVAVVLRKCKILAYKLGHEPLKKWVEQELNGYPDRADLPDYRVIYAPAFGHFSGAFGSGLRGHPIPPQSLDDELRDYAQVTYLQAGIAAYEDMAKSEKKQHQIPWNADLIAFMARRIYKGYACIYAWQVLSRGSLVNLVDTIRNRILSFALELSDEAQGVDLPALKTQMPEGRLDTFFRIYILGDNAQVGGQYTAMSGDTYNVSNNVGSVAIRSKLSNLSQVLTINKSLNEEHAAELRDLFAELNQAISPALETHAEDAAQIAAYAETVALELAKPQPKRKMLNVSLDGLKQAADAVAHITPKVVSCVSRIAQIVSSLPI